MNPADHGALWDILRQLESALRTGTANIQPTLNFYLTALIYWEIVRIGWNGLRGQIGWPALECLIRTGFIVWAMRYYPDLCEGITNTLINIGLRVGGGFVDTGTFLDPGAWSHLSAQAARPLYEAYRGAGWLSGQSFILALYWLAYKAAFIAIAFGVFSAQVQAIISVFISLVTLPTLVFRGTQWIGAQVWARAVNHGMKLMAWATVSGIAYNIAKATALTGQIDAETATRAIILSWAIVLLAFTAQKHAAEALSGMATAGISTGMKWAAATIGSAVATVAGGAALAARGTGMALSAARVGRDVAMASAQNIRGDFAAKGGGHFLRESMAHWRDQYSLARGTSTSQRLGGIAQAAHRIETGYQRTSLRQFADTSRLMRYSQEGHGGVRQ